MVTIWKNRPVHAMGPNTSVGVMLLAPGTQPTVMRFNTRTQAKHYADGQRVDYPVFLVRLHEGRVWRLDKAPRIQGPSQSTRKVFVSLTEQLTVRLTLIAEANGLSRAEVMRRLLRAYAYDAPVQLTGTPLKISR